MSGTKAMAIEHVIDQKVRIQSVCFPKLQKTYLFAQGFSSARTAASQHSDCFSPFPTPLGEWDAGGELFFPNSGLLKDIKKLLK